MAELILEPYAISLHWSRPVELQADQSKPDTPWKTVLSRFLEDLAQRCHASGPCVIGHIKALALFPSGGYLRLSVIAPHLPATAEGEAPVDCVSLDLTLNVIVYGLPRESLENATLAAAGATAAAWKMEVNHTAI